MPLEDGTDSTFGDSHLLSVPLSPSSSSSTKTVSPKAAVGSQGLPSAGTTYALRSCGVSRAGVGVYDLDGRVLDLDSWLDLDGLGVAGDLMDHILVLHLLVGFDP